MHTAKTIALSLGIGIPFLIVMALVSRFFVHWHSKPNKKDIHTIDGHHRESEQLRRRPSSWRQLFATKQKDPNSQWVPTLSGIVKAGDEGVLSAMFTNPQGYPGEISFEAICGVFANELRPRSITDRSAYPGEVLKFVNSTKRGTISPRRVHSVSHKSGSTGRGDIAPATQRKSLDISALERGLGRSLSVKRPAPLLVPLGNGLLDAKTTRDMQRTWTKDGRPAEYYDGRLGVRITPAELALLSVLLGTTITGISSHTVATIEKGAYGAAIHSTLTDEARYIISLTRYKLSVSQLPPSGSGHSPLFAKHLACGSLPFAQDVGSTSSMLLMDDDLRAIRSGTPFTMRRRTQQPSAAKFLTILPHAHDLAIYALEVSKQPSLASPLIDAIAMLPFVGGLAPLASRPLIETVRFVTSGGLQPGRLLQRLEGLVDKVQRHSPQIDIFGPLHEPQNAGLLFRERERLGKVATGTITEDLADGVARTQRYITLIQRLMALVPDMKPQEVLAAVKEATRKDLAHSYATAVATYKSTSGSVSPSSAVHDTHCPQSDARSNRRQNSTASRPSTRCSPQSSLGSGSNSARLSMTFPEYNLGKQIEELLKSELPFSVDMIATVARVVIAAWTFSAGTVAWEEGEKGFRVPDIEELPENMLFV